MVMVVGRFLKYVGSGATSLKLKGRGAWAVSPDHSGDEIGIGQIRTSKNRFEFLEHCSCVQDNIFPLQVAYEYILVVEGTKQSSYS